MEKVGVREQWAVRGKKVQLILWVDESAVMNNPRNSVSLSLEWSADNQSKIYSYDIVYFLDMNVFEDHFKDKIVPYKRKLSIVK